MNIADMLRAVRHEIEICNTNSCEGALRLTVDRATNKEERETRAMVALRAVMIMADTLSRTENVLGHHPLIFFLAFINRMPLEEFLRLVEITSHRQDITIFDGIDGETIKRFVYSAH